MNLIALTLVALLIPADGANWPAFLGGGTEIAPDSVPTNWSPDEGIAWTTKLDGYGQSTPLIWGDRVYLTTAVGDMKDQCRLVCLDLADGTEQWTKDVPSANPREANIYVSRAAPTPVVDDDGVYALFESGNLIAWSHEGEQRWSRVMTEEYGDIEAEFGIASSLVQDDDSIYALVDNDGPSYLAKISKSTGDTVWKVDRTSRRGWSSPVLLASANGPVVLISNQGSVDGYDCQSGEQLFTYTDIAGNTVATPMPDADGRFLTGASPGRDGSDSEVAGRSNVAMRATFADGDWELEVEWVAERVACSFASPIAHDDQAYWVNRQGIVYCFDRQTGEQHFAERLDESCWATPLAVGDRIYFFGRNGTTTVLAAGSEFKKLATNQLWEKDEPAEGDAAGNRGNFGGQTLYGVAVSEGSLVIRTGDTVYCVR